MPYIGKCLVPAGVWVAPPLQHVWGVADAVAVVVGGCGMVVGMGVTTRSNASSLALSARTTTTDAGGER